MILMPAGRACFAAGKGGGGMVATFRDFQHGAPSTGVLTASVDLGAASADRVVAVAVTAQNGFAGSVVVNGVTLTQRAVEGSGSNLAKLFSGIVASGSGAQTVTSTSGQAFTDQAFVLYTITGVASATPKATSATGGVLAAGADIAVTAGDFICMAAVNSNTDWTLSAATETLTTHRFTESSTWRVGGAEKIITATNAAFHVGNDALMAIATFGL